MILLNPLIAEAIRSLAMVQLAAAACSTAIFASFKKEFYTTSRNAVQLVGIGLIIIFISLTAGMYIKLGQPITGPVVGLWIGSLVLDVGIFWAFKKNKFHL